MGNSRISFDPPGGTVNIDFEGFPILLSGLATDDGFARFSRGGVHQLVKHDTWQEYDVMFPAISRPADPARWAQLTAWISWVYRGNVFELLLDGTKNLDTTLDGAIAAGATVITCSDDTANAALDDWIFLEDALDVSVFEWVQVLSNTGASKGITLNANTPVVFAYPDNSIVRQEVRLGNCVLIRDRPTPLVERSGGRGANVWDLRFRFRTVRTP